MNESFEGPGKRADGQKGRFRVHYPLEPTSLSGVHMYTCCCVSVRHSRSTTRVEGQPMVMFM